MDSEIIKEFENYKISKNGEVIGGRYGGIMKPQLSKDGYLSLKLTKDGIRYKRSIHRLLALQYIPNPDILPEVDHIDRNPLNNSIDNLRWVNKITQNGNRACCLKFKTKEELEERLDNIKDKARNWATESRRSKGIKERVIGFDNKEYQRKWAKDKRDNMTPEEKEEYLKHRRESRKPQTEEQKVKSRERAQKQRDSKKVVL